MSSKEAILEVQLFQQRSPALLLCSVLRDTDVYTKNPEPDVAAAIMACDAFHPQLQAILCNTQQRARAGDSLENCEEDACFKKDGHRRTIDARELRWPSAPDC